MKISIIVAVSDNNVIGAKDKLLWHISDDLKRFKKITTGHHILMGQKTFDSIGRVLPDRTNIILSFKKDYKAENAVVFNNPQDAISYAKENGEAELFVIGGGMIYKEFIDKATKIYMTRVHKDYEGDTFFPEIDMGKWKQTFSEKHLEQSPPFEFIVLEKI